jgi:hypothetical protein
MSDEFPSKVADEMLPKQTIANVKGRQRSMRGGIIMTCFGTAGAKNLPS